MACFAIFCVSFALAQPARAFNWFTNAPMVLPRFGHTATLLPNGKVLVAGGQTNNLWVTGTAELFDPTTGAWRLTGSMATNRLGATATLLLNGKVLVAGGYAPGGFNVTNHLTAELYDPATETWANTGSMSIPRRGHTATLLLNGKVLVAGGYADSIGGIAPGIVAEIYDPATGAWSLAGSMSIPRYFHTATLLPDGRALVAGGISTNTVLATAEIYNPANGTWSLTGSMAIARDTHTATLLENGTVLVTGGANSNILSSCELYYPMTGTWSNTTAMLWTHENHTAALIPNGRVVICGGYSTEHNDFSFRTESYDPTNQSWTKESNLTTTRGYHTATLLPNGNVLVAGGAVPGFDTTVTANVEILEPLKGIWQGTGGTGAAASYQTLTLLTNGQVLKTGGYGTANLPLTRCETYNPATETWTQVGSLNGRRLLHTATLLPNGKVLVAGGAGSIQGSVFNPVNTAELYDPVTGAWTLTGSMAVPRYQHSATLLPSGKVLVAGGYDNTNALVSAELYDPATGTWSNASPMNLLNQGRFSHTVVLLPSGKVLVAGGADSDLNTLATAELYDPAMDSWVPTGSMNVARLYFNAILLSDGNVMAIGDASSATAGVPEIYNPADGLWTPAATQHAIHYQTPAILLPDGTVVVADQASEIYDPVTKLWRNVNTLPAGVGSSLTILPNGKVLEVGGGVTNAYLFDLELGSSNAWRPQVTGSAGPFNAGGILSVTGAQFRGLSAGGGGDGTQSSPSGFPIVQLRRVDSQQVVTLPTTGWTTNSLVTQPLTNFPAGPALLTVFVNGIQSVSSPVLINHSVAPTMIVLFNPTRLPNGSFQFSFTNVPGGTFTALAATNLTTRTAGWNTLGTASEVTAGHYQFTDVTATSAQKFYRVRSP